MYDSKNEIQEFIADNRDAAIRKATEYFDVETDALKIGGFSEGDVYGLGGRAVIVASLRDRTVPTGGGSGGGRDRGDRGGRGGGRDRGGRDRDRGGRDRGGRDRGGRGGNRRDASAHDSGPAAAPIAAGPTTTEPSVGTPTGTLGEIGKFVLGSLERMNVGPFEISETAEGELLAFEVSGQAAAALAGGDGRPVDALQLLANQVAARNEDGPKRIVLDVEGNADAREDFLTSLAARAAGRGRKTGRAVALDPMNGRDRRSIHLALRDETDVATMSVGEGRYRQVMIVPEGAPEYENARRESEAVQQQES